MPIRKVRTAVSGVAAVALVATGTAITGAASASAAPSDPTGHEASGGQRWVSDLTSGSGRHHGRPGGPSTTSTSTSSKTSTTSTTSTQSSTSLPTGRIGSLLIGEEFARVRAAVSAEYSGITVRAAREDADGTLHALGGRDGKPVMMRVSKDLRTVTLEA